MGLIKLELERNLCSKRKPENSVAFSNIVASTLHPFKRAFIACIKVILLETVELDSLIFQMAL